MSTEDEIKATKTKAQFTVSGNDPLPPTLSEPRPGLKVRMSRKRLGHTYVPGNLGTHTRIIPFPNRDQDIDYGEGLVEIDHLYRHIGHDFGEELQIKDREFLAELTTKLMPPPKVRTVSNEEFLKRARRIRKKHARLLDALGK